MTIILGINAFHADSSCCVVVDGGLIAAVEEERIRRVKHWAGFPVESIKYCLKEAGITIAQVNHVALNSDPKASILKKVVFSLKTQPGLGLVIDRIKNRSARTDVVDELAKAFPGESIDVQVHRIEHHLSHLASAHLVSPFSESVTVSVDGFGDFSSGAWGVGRGIKIDVGGRIYFPHSLGIFYQAMTQFIGFLHYGDEYKVMGLAPYGKPAYMNQMRELVAVRADGTYALNLDYFRHHKEKVDYEWAGGSPVVGKLFSDKMAELFGFTAREKSDPVMQRHWDIAHSVQAMYEEAFFSILGHAHEKYRIDNLTLAGGCAMNSVANGKIYRRTAFKDVYIQSAAGDAGGAIGCAFVVANQLRPSGERFRMDHAYWGPSFDNAYHEELLASRKQELKSAGCSVEYIQNEGRLCSLVADSIGEGMVIGWFQGRMEWGPRALGNRSILCDPRRADMKEILNSKIKRRESFRPFAPSILREYVKDWFEEEDDVPFMMQVFQIKEDKRGIIPAVTHVDGSGRLQTVSKDTNKRYHRLIQTFGDKTGVPILLNTSFNENEPVVCMPDEALDCFLRTKMDALVLSDYFIRRRHE